MTIKKGLNIYIESATGYKELSPWRHVMMIMKMVNLCRLQMTYKDQWMPFKELKENKYKKNYDHVSLLYIFHYVRKLTVCLPDLAQL